MIVAFVDRVREARACNLVQPVLASPDRTKLGCILLKPNENFGSADAAGVCKNTTKKTKRRREDEDEEEERGGTELIVCHYPKFSGTLHTVLQHKLQSSRGPPSMVCARTSKANIHTMAPFWC